MSKSKLISFALIIRRYIVFLLYIALSCAFLTGYHFYYHAPTWSDGFHALQRNPAGKELDRDLRSRSMGVYFLDTGEWIGDDACARCFSIRFDAQTKHGGYFQRGLPFITLSASTREQTAIGMASIIAHEIQHAMDYVDGLPYTETRSNKRALCVKQQKLHCLLGP